MYALSGSFVPSCRLDRPNRVSRGSERGQNQETDGDADATVGDVKCGPGVLVEVEIQEVDDVASGHAVDQIPKYACGKETKRNLRCHGQTSFRVDPIADQEKEDDDERGDSQENKEQIIVLEQPERGAGVRCVNQAEEPWNDGNFSAIGNVPQDKVFRDLIKNEEGEP